MKEIYNPVRISIYAVAKGLAGHELGNADGTVHRSRDIQGVLAALLRIGKKGPALIVGPSRLLSRPSFEPPLLAPLVALLELPLDPHAATATTRAIAATRVSVSRNGRM